MSGMISSEHSMQTGRAGAATCGCRKLWLEAYGDGINLHILQVLLAEDVSAEYTLSYDKSTDSKWPWVADVKMSSETSRTLEHSFCSD